MGREVQLLLESREWYVVDVDDNRDDPDPMMVEIGPMDAGESEAFKHAAVMATRAKTDVDALAVAYRRESKKRDNLVRSRCYTVKGYSVRDSATGEVFAPTTGEELVKVIHRKGVPSTEIEILEDIKNAIEDRSVLEAGLRKKSDS